ncbi:nitroreductase family protein [Streptomyces flaveolus]|uniref:nitroreductase family protein n=1 Tax=Streptomyces flaveolus TaxID=67297 RepID=UPI003703564F
MTRSGQRQRYSRAPSARSPRRGFLRRLKWRLQWTGWLQYLPTITAAVLLLTLSAAGKWAGNRPVVFFWLPFGAGVLLLAAFAFDVVTVKFGLHPVERVPRRRDDLDAFGLMRARRSCRSFQSRPLSDADREELMRAVREHTRPERLVGTHPIRLEYLAAPLTVWPTVGAHEFIVAIAPREYDRLSVIDVGRSLHKVVLHATRMGLATCWIGPGADPSSIAAHLGSRFDPSAEHVICVCAVGYRSRFKPLAVRLIELPQRRRLPLASLFFADPRFHTSLATDSPPFSAFRRCYQACRSAPSSFNDQTSRCVGVRNDDGKGLPRFDFYTTTESRYYAPVGLGIWCATWEAGCGALGIPGHLQVLSPEARGVREAPVLPRYDVSWIADVPAAS